MFWAAETVCSSEWLNDCVVWVGGGWLAKISYTGTDTCRTDKGGPTLVDVSGLYLAASPFRLLRTDDPLVGGGEAATLTALDVVVEGGGMGHDSMEGEKMPLEETLTPPPPGPIAAPVACHAG